MALKKWAAEARRAPSTSLTRASDGKQECFYHHAIAAGAALAEVIQAVIEQALGALPIPKVMSYQLADGVTTVSFVRPAHRLAVLHGEQVLPCRVLGLDRRPPDRRPPLPGRRRHPRSSPPTSYAAAAARGRAGWSAPSTRGAS